MMIGEGGVRETECQESFHHFECAIMFPGSGSKSEGRCV